MSDGLRPPPLAERVAATLGEPRISSALALVAVGTVFASTLLRAVMGWGGLLGALGAVAVLAGMSLYGQRRMIEWVGLLPISILVFVGWCAISTIWSSYPVATVAAVVYQLVVAFLAVYVALVRDTIQVVRTIGDVLRFLLALSLALEVFAGLLIDQGIPFLQITGSLAAGGPIEGVFGTRNLLGLMALVGLVTFFVELRTRSVKRGIALVSIPLSLVCVALSRSPVIAVVALLVVVAMAALYGLRRMSAPRRWWGQLVLAVVLVASGILALVFRARLIVLLSAGNVADVRVALWQEMWSFIKLQPLQGWGFIGFWRTQFTPYLFLDDVTGTGHGSGLNAFLDVTLQTGFIGLVLFAGLVLLAFGRAWLLASNKRSTIYVWAPLVLVCLITVSAAESSILAEAGWMLFVICAVKAAQGMSWRSALARPLAAPLAPVRD